MFNTDVTYEKYKYDYLHLFSISNDYKLAKLNGILTNWWDDNNEFLFDHLFSYFDYQHSFKEEIENDIFLSKLYKIGQLKLHDNEIGAFFTKIANEPISVCFDLIVNIVNIRDTLKLDYNNTFKNVLKASFHQEDYSNCKYDDSDEKDKKRIHCNSNSIPFYEIVTWDCDYITKHREMIGRIPDEIRYSYEPVTTTDTSANFGFLRFDHMIEWLNFYNTRLYGDKTENTITSTSKCSDDQSSKSDAQNELIDDIYMFIESETDMYKFRKLLFGEEGDNNRYNTILKKKHYNILRELQFNNMIFVNSVFADIIVKKSQELSTIIDKKRFIPLLRNPNMYSMIQDDINIIDEMIRTKIFLDSYASKSIQRPEYKEIITSAFLRYIGFFNIYHLLDFENDSNMFKESDIVKKINEIEKQYLPVILVLKDSYETIHIFKVKEENLARERQESFINQLNKDIYSSDKKLNDYLKEIIDELGVSQEEEKEEYENIINKRVFKQKTIYLKDVRLISSIIQYRMQTHKILNSHLQKNIFEPIFEDFNRPKLRALLKSMVKVLDINELSNKYQNKLNLSNCDECKDDILNMAEKLENYLKKTPNDDNGGIIMKVNDEDEDSFKLDYEKYQKSIILSIMQIGFKVFLLELAHHLANNKSTNLVGDINSLSRTARSSYELKDSLDLGDFYY